MSERDHPYLTQDEVDALPEGTEVVVTWSGGNGPHTYRIVHVNGEVCTDNVYRDRLDFVGEKQPFTQVRLA